MLRAPAPAPARRGRRPLLWHWPWRCAFGSPAALAQASNPRGSHEDVRGTRDSSGGLLGRASADLAQRNREARTRLCGRYDEAR